MTTEELRAFIIVELNNLDKEQLLKLESFIENLKAEDKSTLEETSAQYGLSEWEKLSEAQRKGILEAEKSLRENGGIPHDVVMKELRARYEL